MKTHFQLPEISNSVDFHLHFNDEVWRKVAVIICQRHNLSFTNLQRATQGENIIFFVDEKYVVKIFAPFRNQFQREVVTLEFFHGTSQLETPEIVFKGELDGWFYIVMKKLPGIVLRERWATILVRERIEIAEQLGTALRQFHARNKIIPTNILEWRAWQDFVEYQAATSFERQKNAGAKAEWLESLPEYLENINQILPAKFETTYLHGDVHSGNLLAQEVNGRWKLTGLFDFGDSFCGFREYEFVAPGVLMFQGNCEAQRTFLKAYGYQENELNVDLRSRLMLLTILYECSDLRKYALRLAPEAVNFSLFELERVIWTFAEKN